MKKGETQQKNATKLRET